MWRLRPLTFLPASYPRTPLFRGLHRLRVEDGRARGGLPALYDSGLLSERVVNTLQHTRLRPPIEEPIDRLPGRELVGKHAPTGAATYLIEERVDDFAQAVLALPVCVGQQRLDPIPLGIGHVGRVGASAHAAKITLSDALHQILKHTLRSPGWAVKRFDETVFDQFTADPRAQYQDSYSGAERTESHERLSWFSGNWTFHPTAEVSTRGIMQPSGAGRGVASRAPLRACGRARRGSAPRVLRACRAG
jgi:hypothetical protein